SQTTARRAAAPRGTRFQSAPRPPVPLRPTRTGLNSAVRPVASCQFHDQGLPQRALRQLLLLRAPAVLAARRRPRDGLRRRHHAPQRRRQRRAPPRRG
uniref:Uncharacterized protein n=1 Tax=Aegilops tauschii subsp. strangulata TaxID=200361 RepID=A0A453RE02_AEGTS